MKQSKIVYTSISISEERYLKFKSCALRLDVEEARLLSVLCYKAGIAVCNELRSLQSIDYQPRNGGYKIRPVHFLSADHEYMHSKRLACKVSVSKLLSLAIDLFIDEIMEKGINTIEIAHLRVIQNTYRKKSHFIRNLSFEITQNSQFDEYVMKMRLEKT